MTFEIAALLGMASVLFFGIAALMLAYISGKNKDEHRVGGHHA